jgi:hypothetical protein
MKIQLPDFTQDLLLNKVREAMNAPLLEMFIVEIREGLTEDDLRQLIAGGKDIDIAELQILEDGTLAYKGERILLHIRDIKAHHEYDPRERLPRFHISDCKKLNEMRDAGRFERYVISIRTDGKFNLNFIKANQSAPEIHELVVCMLCLERLSYKGYGGYEKAKKYKIRDDFSIEEYFSLAKQGTFSSKPKHTSADAPLDIRPDNWDEISYKFRERIGFRCQKCDIDLKGHRKYLHVHHKNSKTNDNADSNLEALCIYCHAQEYMHSHVKNHPDYKDFLVLRQTLQRSSQQASPSTTREPLTPRIQGVINAQKEQDDDTFEKARQMASKRSIRIQDFRSKGGAFWVCHDNETDDLATALSSLSFYYKTGRGWWKK